jgi:hypothetical protein
MPGEPLPLAGLHVRQYVKVKKDDRAAAKRSPAGPEAA